MGKMTYAFVSCIQSWILIIIWNFFLCLLFQVVNREALVFLCINYAFFSVVVLSFILFMIILTHTSSSQDDLLTSMAIMAMCFIFVDLIVANFLVQTIHMNMEVKLILWAWECPLAGSWNDMKKRDLVFKNSHCDGLWWLKSFSCSGVLKI